MVISSQDPSSRQYLLIKFSFKEDLLSSFLGSCWQHLQEWLQLQRLSLPTVISCWEQPTSNDWWGVYISQVISVHPMQVVGAPEFLPWGLVIGRICRQIRSQLNYSFCQILLPSSPLCKCWFISDSTSVSFPENPTRTYGKNSAKTLAPGSEKTGNSADLDSKWRPWFDCQIPQWVRQWMIVSKLRSDHLGLRMPWENP